MFAAGSTPSSLRFPSSELPPGFGTAVLEITDGHPLFVSSLLDDLVAQGILAEEGGSWRLRKRVEALGDVLPDSLRHLIAVVGARAPAARGRASWRDRAPASAEPAGCEVGARPWRAYVGPWRSLAGRALARFSIGRARASTGSGRWCSLCGWRCPRTQTS